MNESQSKSEQLSSAIPVATTEPAKLQIGGLSAMWWLTLVCLLLAIGLVWWSLPEQGMTIKVRFPEGHGLQSDDQVLFRGIEVGVVEEVELSEDLEAIDVQINLKSSAAQLAREGTRFWIVRPQLSLSRITGLETAVGHKYVSLSPGPEEAERKYKFEGLIDPPPEDAASPGVEIVVRGDKRHSVSPGSTVTFRGVEVGRILSVGLSQDSRYVDVRAKIFDRYRQNLTTSSRFWATSGINVDFSLTGGLNVDTESLASIAQGGVSFLTIDNGGDPVQAGHVFRLYGSPEDDWASAADSVSSTNIELGGVIAMRKQWRQKGLLGKRTKSTGFNGIPLKFPNGERRIVVPWNVKQFSSKTIEGTALLIATLANEDVAIEQPQSVIKTFGDQTELAYLDWHSTNGVDWLDAKTDFRQFGEPESCVAVRSTNDDGKTHFLHYPIEQSYLRDDWTLPQFDGDPELWHGSPVLSVKDGKVLGVLLVEDEKARMVGLSF